MKQKTIQPKRLKIHGIPTLSFVGKYCGRDVLVEDDWRTQIRRLAESSRAHFPVFDDPHGVVIIGKKGKPVYVGVADGGNVKFSRGNIVANMIQAIEPMCGDSGYLTVVCQSTGR